jgi:hypothetical protein
MRSALQAETEVNMLRACFVGSLVGLSVLAGNPCLAGEVQKFYYLGDVKVSSESGEPRPGEVILLEKTQDPDKGVIVERAIEVKSDQSASEYVMTLKVSGNSFTITDRKNTIHGSGTLFGPAWQWTYFKGTFEANNGARIEDENFMTDPSVGCARKKVYAPDGKVIMVMDVTLKAVTQQTFEVLAAALVKK